MVNRRRIIDKIYHAEQVSVVLNSMYEACTRINSDKFSYHFKPLFGHHDLDGTEVFAVGFPEDWVARYNLPTIQVSDPVPQTIMKAGRVMTWSDAIGETDLSDAEKCFIKAARDSGIIHGIGIPLWGPDGQNAYASLGFPNDQLGRQLDRIFETQLLVQAGHQKICELVRKNRPEISISAREAEVLTWMGRGKSKTDIATILNISPDTVTTYVRRSYEKLGSSDRVGAVVRALKLGLIRL